MISNLDNSYKSFFRNQNSFYTFDTFRSSIKVNCKILGIFRKTKSSPGGEDQPRLQSAQFRQRDQPDPGGDLCRPDRLLLLWRQQPGGQTGQSEGFHFSSAPVDDKYLSFPATLRIEIFN